MKWILCYTILVITLVAIVKAKKLPNIVIILTDDQDSTLDGMFPMGNVKRLIGTAGATFENAVTREN